MIVLNNYRVIKDSDALLYIEHPRWTHVKLATISDNMQYKFELL